MSQMTLTQNEHRLIAIIEDQRDAIIEALMAIVRVPALAPQAGGDGEAQKAQLILEMIEPFGFDEIERFDAPDPRTSSGLRPNIMAIKHGRHPGHRICVVAHMDVVPPGDLSRWTVPPFEPQLRDGKMIGRGVEDNGQELIAALYGVKALTDAGLTPDYTIAVVLVADEETGSKYGISHLIGQGVFDRTDRIIVPDSGIKDGTFIEVAEKSIMWLRIRTSGRQCHASQPSKGVNAFRVASVLITELDAQLKAKYDRYDVLYDEPPSTFEPTRKEANVPNINTIPGEDIFYMDCRILPEYDPDEVLATVKAIAAEVAQAQDAKISVETVQFERAALATTKDAPVVGLLTRAIQRVTGREPNLGGIGGGTCAAIFRRAGYPAVVWSTIEDVAHSDNEYIMVDNLILDAKIYALMFATPVE